jgi:thiosulfate/3-mercaptopyruvate sulfurtransferase
MKKLVTVAFLFTSIIFASAQTLWKKEQLMPTKDLAEKIKTNAKDLPLIFNVGPMEQIKTAKSIGLGTSISAMEKLKSSLSMESKARTVVVYCGCCSYENCPNIKPAYDALIAAGFKNAKVLELPEGIKPDWVAKGFPMQE